MPGRKAPEETRREDILRAAYDVAARHGLGALTLRAVAQRADVSHGTVLFHFKRRSELVAGLLERVLYATTVLRIPYLVDRITRPSEKLRALLRSEMDRLTSEARHFRLFLEYWALGVRSAGIRKRISASLDAYRSGWQTLLEAVIAGEPNARAGVRALGSGGELEISDGAAGVAVSLVQGCALQAVIDPKGFNLQQHFNSAARLLDGLAAAPEKTRGVQGAGARTTRRRVREAR